MPIISRHLPCHPTTFPILKLSHRPSKVFLTHIIIFCSVREEEVKVLVPWDLELPLNPVPLTHSSQEDISWVQRGLIKLMSWYTAVRRLEKCMQTAGVDLSVFHTKAGLSLCPLWPSSSSTTASRSWPFPNAAYTSLLYCGKHCWIPDPRKILLQRQYLLGRGEKNPKD